MHIHILGIGGTFMGGIASLAVELGYKVTGSDQNIYPPMSTQLESLGIDFSEGYLPEHVGRPDMVVIGNALKRGNPAVEYVLNEGLRYQSGPQWLFENILQDRWVIGVAGTHGKTTTSSMIAWALTYAGLEPGFLIGGIPANFGVSAKCGKTPFFVVEADEYDCAFFDKRSKFVHYHPKTCVLNNLEFDHADIFNNLEEIQKQFHHLVRTVPGNGAVISPAEDKALQEVLAKGLWSDSLSFGVDGDWQASLLEKDGSCFEVFYKGQSQGRLTWGLIGEHNVHNALATLAACAHAGVPAKITLEALAEFQSVKRRMEIRGQVNGITVYDDFAHHPTAIRMTTEGLRAKVGAKRLIAVVDVRSNTMCMGTHQLELPESLKVADEVFVYQSPQVKWSVEDVFAKQGIKAFVAKDVQTLIEKVSIASRSGDHVLVMSNGGFDNFHQRLLDSLEVAMA